MNSDESSGPSRRLVIGAALVGLGVAVFGIVMIGGLVGNATRSDEPPIVAEASPTPIVAPSAAPSAAAPSPSASEGSSVLAMDERFTSALYGYSIAHPGNWAASAAERAWYTDEALSAGGSADILSDPGPLPGPGSASLRIAATEVAPGADLDAWVTAHAGTLTPYGFLESAERTCRIPVGGSTTMIPAGPGAFETQLVAGHPARVRAQCGYVAAVVLVKDLMYAMSFYTGVSPSADLDLFDRFASTLVFDAVAPRAPTGFVSPLYDYALQVPAGWEAQAATASWPGTGPTAEAPVADVFESPGTKPGARSAHRFSVVAMEVSPGLDAQAWARKHIALPPEVEEMGAPGHRHCRFGGMMVDEPIGDWYATRIGGHPAFAREVCRTVDAVVVVGDHLYQMRHRGPRPHEFTPGQWTPFKVIADSMTFSRP